MHTEFSAAYNDLIEALSGLFDASGVLFFHTDCRATAADISGDGVNIFYVEHYYGFFTDGFCCFFHVEFFCYGDNEDVIVFAGSLSDKRLVDFFIRKG